MKLTVKILSILILLILASPVLLFQGCGDDNELCGGCPANSSAPFGSTVTGPGDATYPVTVSGGASSNCINSQSFVFKDAKGDPLNGICVEVFTNGFVAPAGSPGACGANPDYTNYLRTRTDNSGTVTIDFYTGIITRPTTTTTPTTENRFVQVNSCSTSATWKGTWTVTWN